MELIQKYSYRSTLSSTKVHPEWNLAAWFRAESEPYVIVIQKLNEVGFHDTMRAMALKLSKVSDDPQ